VRVLVPLLEFNQDLNHQKLVLLEFARKRGLKIDEFVEVTISSRKTSKQRRIDELLQLLNKTDTPDCH